MARSDSNSIPKLVGAALAVTVGGLAIGYVIGAMRPAHPSEQIAQEPPAPAITTPKPPRPSPAAIHPRTANGDYTAPGAPRIAIREEKPTLRRINPEVATGTTTDTEASQAAPPPVKVSKSTPTVTPAPPADHTGDTAPAPSPAPNADTGGTQTTTVGGDSAPALPAAPSDPDFEHVDRHDSPDAGLGSGDKAQFRVQTGAYADESNARSVVDQLRGEGYTANTRSEREGDHLVYKVQVGAYRSKGGANKAAEDLQKKGYPAYVSPISQ